MTQSFFKRLMYTTAAEGVMIKHDENRRVRAIQELGAPYGAQAALYRAALAGSQEARPGAIVEVQQEARDLAWLVTWGLELGDPVISVLLPQLQLESAAKSALVRRAMGVE